MDDNLENSSLDDQLDAFDNDSNWVVLETFKQTGRESTQKVIKRDNEWHVYGPFIRKEFSEDSKQGSAYERLWQEQLKGRTLKHCPKIVDYYEYAQHRVVILDFVEGETLEHYIRNNKLTDAQIKQLFLKICDAVEELHFTFEQPLIHRDLKPTNIIVKDGDACIIDLGIARFRRGGFTPDTTQFGTPSFAPPEQYGFGETSIESDIYALGMVLYFMLTKKLSNTPLCDNETFESEIPEEFQATLLKATTFDPKERYHSANEMKCALSSPIDSDMRNHKKLTEKFRDKFGTIWNVCVVAFWIILMIGVFGGLIQPNEDVASRSLAYRLVGYIGVTGVPLTIYCFAILEKSKLKQRFPTLKRLNKKGLFILCIIAFFIMALSATISNFL